MDSRSRLRVLHIEDDAGHAELVRRAIDDSGLHCDVCLAMSRKEFTAALDKCAPDLILSDNRGYDFDGLEALRLARQRYPSVPFLFVSTSLDGKDVDALKKAGATACLLKSDLDEVSKVIRNILGRREGTAPASLDFQRLFEQSPDILLVLLPDPPRYTIVGATQARLVATQTKADQFGKGLFEVFPDNPDDTAASGTSNLRASLDRVVATRAPDTMAVQKYDIRDPDGHFVSKYWSPRNVPVLSEDGKILYILHRVEEVTELVHAAEEGEELRGRTREMEREVVKRSRELAAANTQLREANAKLGELDVAKTAFFSNISHEFRTPLTLLLGPLEDLLAAPAPHLPDDFRRRLELAHQNALRLLKLVNALLDFSRLEAGRMRAHYVPTDITQRTRELAAFFQSAADKAGLRLMIECEPLGEPAYVDPEMWEKIVLNLLSNAFKYTLAGGITVRLHESSGQFVLQVEDTGTGIPEDQLTHVFERFYRVQGAESRSHEGSGIGLSLVQELVKLHGGSVSASSATGRGSTFTVSIPKGKDHLPADSVGLAADQKVARDAGVYASEVQRWLPEQAEKEAAIAQPAPEAGRERVLLVDDNADLRLFVSQLLQPHYEVEVAEDGEQALQRVLESPPDLVLSDVMMPKLDGFGLLQRLRADPRSRDVPVILLSARAGEEASVEGMEAGADDYLIKPFSARELLARVRTHLGLARNRRQWAHELEMANRELEAFSSSVSHDLRGPLRSISGFAALLAEDYGPRLDETGRSYIQYVTAGTKRMAELIEDLLKLAHVSRAPVQREAVDLAEVARLALMQLRLQDPDRACEVEVQDDLKATGDKRLVTIVMENLLSNAWKFTSKRKGARISIGRELQDGRWAFYVRDNGSGFDMGQSDRLFAPFQRLHSEQEYAGTGIGLATVKRIVARHGGRIWVDAAEGQGATFFFTFDDGR